MSALCRYEAVLDRAAVAPGIEALMPSGGRPRQLPVRTLLVGICLALHDARPAHLTRVHQALVGLGVEDRRRLGVEVDRRVGPHLLTYRQVTRTFALMAAVLASSEPDGTPSAALGAVLDDVMEASVPAAWAEATSATAIDWSDFESHCAAPHSDEMAADPEASWGRRHATSPGQRDDLFFGYYLQAVTMVNEEHGLSVPELVRRVLLTSCRHDPPKALVPVLERLAKRHGLGDLLMDSGYSHRDPRRVALRLRRAGAALVMDLHPGDRGPRGTHEGAVINNGSLYCPATPQALLALGPLARQASKEETDRHDRMSAELEHYRLGRHTAGDADGYHRVICPAAMGKLRCPLRSTSMTLSLSKAEVLSPPEHPPGCCTQTTLTVGPEVAAATAQKHPYPSAAHRHSYGRRSAAERTFAKMKDPARNHLTKGWCRVFGLSATSVFIACAFVVHNVRVLDAFDRRRDDERRRGSTPQRRRRRRTSSDLVIAVNA